MPISIRDYTGKSENEPAEEVDWLCSDDWELPSQIDGLEKWLESMGKNLLPGDYVADVGFSPREGACGGGGVLSPQSMSIMGAIGMSLHLSEYPEMREEET